jgi:hypothetical protein
MTDEAAGRGHGYGEEQHITNGQEGTRGIGTLALGGNGRFRFRMALLDCVKAYQPFSWLVWVELFQIGQTFQHLHINSDKSFLSYLFLIHDATHIYLFLGILARKLTASCRLLPQQSLLP